MKTAFDNSIITHTFLARCDFEKPPLVPTLGGFSIALNLLPLDPGENQLRAEKAVVYGGKGSHLVIGRVESSPASVSRAKPAFGPKRVSACTTLKPLFSTERSVQFPRQRASSRSGIQTTCVRVHTRYGRKNNGYKAGQGRRGSGLQTQGTGSRIAAVSAV